MAGIAAMTLRAFAACILSVLTWVVGWQRSLTFALMESLASLWLMHPLLSLMSWEESRAQLHCDCCSSQGTTFSTQRAACSRRSGPLK
jgi:hypothetical protein